MMTRWTAFTLILLIPPCSNAWAGGAGSDDDPEDFFERKVRPILAGTCVKCHGPVKASGGLRFDSREAMLKGGETGPAVVPGDAKRSLLIQAVQHEDESLEMPPGKLLPGSARADLAAWVADGARWPKSARRLGRSPDRSIGPSSRWAASRHPMIRPDGPSDRSIGSSHLAIAAALRPARPSRPPGPDPPRLP